MCNKKKIVVFYYTQSGQIKSIVDSICRPMDVDGFEVIYKEIIPERSYPFLWGYNNFFEVFAECRAGVPPYGIKEIDLSDVQDASLVIVGGQSWFLSPSLPIQSFFLSSQIRDFLKNKKIVFVNGCRNMWLSTIREIRKYVSEIGGDLVGHIVLQDNTPNLISVITIVRWLFFGKKEASKIWPAAGVSEEDITNASRFGEKIIDFIQNDKDFSELQNELMEIGAIKYKPGVIYVEKVGHRIFGLWSKFIRKKGGYEDKNRSLRVKIFSYYLFFVLYIISPLGILVYYLTYPIRMFFIKKQMIDACYNLSYLKNN